MPVVSAIATGPAANQGMHGAMAFARGAGLGFFFADQVGCGSLHGATVPALNAPRIKPDPTRTTEV